MLIIEINNNKFECNQDEDTHEWKVKFQMNNGVKGTFITPKWRSTRLFQYIDTLVAGMV